MTAQTETGQITGTVTDATGAVLQHAKVTVKSLATGLSRETTTSAAGVYTVPNLLPGSYQVSASAPNFATARRTATVAVGARVGLDFQLEVGTEQTVVQVEGAGQLVNTETQTMENMVTTRQVLDLPTLTRNPYSLVVTAGNVSESEPSLRGVGVSINGQRAAGTNILLDGASNNDEFTAEVGQQVPLDSVQEFSVITNNFTAEYGRASGGVVNVATKSGTNDYHGSVYEFNRVSRFTSNSFDNNANGVPKPVFTRNQFGYSVGGPILKDKLFVFQNTEWIRVRSAATRFVWVPTPELIGASAAPTQEFFRTYGALRPGLSTIQTLSRNQLTAQGFDPCRGAAAGGPCLSLSPTLPMFSRVAYNYPADSGGGDPQDTYMLVGRVDYNLSDRTQLYGRYALYSENDFRGVNADSPYQGFDTGITHFNNNFLLSATHTFRPTLISQTKAVFNRLNEQQPLGDRPPVPTLYTNPTGPGSIFNNFIAYPGYLPFNPGSAIPFGGPQNFLQFYHDMSWVKGKHDVRFGGSYVHMQDNRMFGAYQEAVEALSSGSVASSIDNFLRGELFSFTAAVYPQGKFPCVGAPTDACTLTLPVGQPDFTRSNRYNEFAFYGQDSWKVKPRFTLNLGLRWEYFGVQHNKNPQLDSNFYDGTGGTLADRVRSGQAMLAPNSPIGGLWAKDRDNFAPRVGFAWDIFGDGKTSLRGGYGIGYERNFGNVTFNVIQNPPNYAVVDLRAGRDVAAIPITVNNLGPLAGTSGSKALPRSSLRNVDQNIETAYAQFWGVSLQRQLNGGLMVGLSYSGSRGQNLYSLANVNQPGYGNIYLGIPCTPGTSLGDPGTCVDRLNQQYSTMYRRGNLGFSRYNGFNTRVEARNVAHSGVSLVANYTWSHSIDNGSSTFSDTTSKVPSANNGDFVVGLLDYFHPALDKGDSEWDVRHRLAISGVWEIPSGRFQGPASGRILGGWMVAPIFTAHTGTPFSIFDCTYAANVCARAAFNGPMPRTGADNPTPTATPNTFRFMELPAANVVNFVNPAYNVSDYFPFPGNMSGRDAFRAPGWWNLDFAVMKNTKINERFSVQLRGEAYNIFNHANLYVQGASADVSSTDFIPASRGSTGATFDRRNLQLAVKLIF
ncbi:MAG: carboxypeptidase regulatory-like domain-containing protein [Bryobacteraceae bacterium]